MAGVFEILISGFLCQREPNLKWSRVGFWIVDGDLVLDLVWTDSSKPLGQLQSVAGGRTATVAGGDSSSVSQKIRGFDDECIAFPVAAGVAHVRADGGIRMRTPVDWNDTGFVHHFLEDRDVAWRLNDLLAISIDHRENRTRYAASNATNVIAEVFPGIRLRIVVSGSFRHGSRSRLGKHVGDPAIRRIYDQRCLLARTPGALAPMTRRTGADARIRRYELLQIVLLLPRKLTLALCKLLLRVVKPITQIGRAVQWRADAIIAGPCSLEIRSAPRLLPGRPPFS